MLVARVAAFEHGGHENLVFFQQKIRHNAAVFFFFGVDHLHRFGTAHQKIKLGGQAVVGGIEVKLLQKRVALGAFGEIKRIEIAGQALAHFRFAAADGAFYNDITIIHAGFLYS